MLLDFASLFVLDIHLLYHKMYYHIFCQKIFVIMDLLGELQRAEFKEAFDEFDKVNC